MTSNFNEDAIKKGLENYNKMLKAWEDLLRLSPREESDDTMKSWMDSMASINKDVFGMFSKSLAKPDMWMAPDKEKWEEFAKSFQKPFAAFPTDAKMPFQSMDDLAKFSSEWHESFTKLVNSWLEGVRKISEFQKLEDKDKSLAEYFDATEAFLNSWTSFRNEQTKAMFILWKNSVLKMKENAGKKEPEKKAAKK
jgi:hypothetical protein